MSILAILIMIVMSTLPFLFLFALCSSFIRLNKFSKLVSDEVDYRYSSSFEDYVSRTKLDIIPITLTRKKRDIDIHASYANLVMLEFWNWDFQSMLVDEVKKR